jgi:hypothetical protein
MSETGRLIAAIDELKDTVRRFDIRAALPAELQLLTADEIMDVFQVEKSKFYEMKLPRFVDRGVIRYRVSDLPEYVRAKMQTFDGRPLEKREARRRRSKDGGPPRR